MWRKGGKRIFAHSFQPAASPKALKRISRSVRGWALHHRSYLSLTELAAMHNELRVFAPRSRRKRPVGPTRARGLLVCRTYGNFTRSWLMVG
jgi:hypothetical protein